jgi:elongation factor Ts
VEIKATDVKKLREITGAGMMDCKNALMKSGGDLTKAERLLKEQGLAAAAKKSGRATNSGRVFTKLLPDKGLLLELTCETDFVAKNSLFINLGTAILDTVAAKKLTAKTEELELMVKETVGKIKENMELRRIVTFPVAPDEAVSAYNHDDRIDPGLKDNPRLKEVLFETALHVAAFAPLYLSRDKVETAFLKDQEDIFSKQVESMNKPANVLAGIIKGKLNKLVSEICLLDQPFVKDEKRKVSKVFEDLGKEIGSKVELSGFAYVKVGDER